MNHLEYGTRVTDGIAAQVAGGESLRGRVHDLHVWEGVDGQVTVSCELDTRRGRHHVSTLLVGLNGPFLDAETFVTVFVSSLIERLDMSP